MFSKVLVANRGEIASLAFRAYLDPEAIGEVALRAGADAVYPGYGFLSENPALAEACAKAGITFIGPSAAILTLTGNKARAITAARAVRVHRAGGREPAALRGPDPRRRRGQRDAPVRAGLLGPASPPEGGRDRPG